MSKVFKNNDNSSKGILLFRSQNQKSRNPDGLSVGTCSQEKWMMTNGNMERLKTQGVLKQNFFLRKKHFK